MRSWAFKGKTSLKKSKRFLLARALSVSQAFEDKALSVLSKPPKIQACRKRMWPLLSDRNGMLKTFFFTFVA